MEKGARITPPYPTLTENNFDALSVYFDKQFVSRIKNHAV